MNMKWTAQKMKMGFVSSLFTFSHQRAYPSKILSPHTNRHAYTHDVFYLEENPQLSSFLGIVGKE